jgi:hypothetical protein
LHILADEDTNVDEIAWEHHGMWARSIQEVPPVLVVLVMSLMHNSPYVFMLKVAGNYLMKLAWGPHAAQLTLRESYEYFLKMRNKGIRAHSWI